MEINGTRGQAGFFTPLHARAAQAERVQQKRDPEPPTTARGPAGGQVPAVDGVADQMHTDILPAGTYRVDTTVGLASRRPGPVPRARGRGNRSEAEQLSRRLRAREGKTAEIPAIFSTASARSEAAKEQHAVSNPRAGDSMSGKHTSSVRTKGSTNAGAEAKAAATGTNRGAVQRDPSWDALHAMLDRSEHGPECRERLIALGAPANGAAADAPVAREKAGRPRKESTKFVDISTGGTDRSVARLKRDHPELAADVIAGRLSAHAAAVQAGIFCSP